MFWPFPTTESFETAFVVVSLKNNEDNNDSTISDDENFLAAPFPTPLLFIKEDS